jgi:hypothetical protein
MSLSQESLSALNRLCRSICNDAINRYGHIFQTRSIQQIKNDDPSAVEDDSDPNSTGATTSGRSYDGAPALPQENSQSMPVNILAILQEATSAGSKQTHPSSSNPFASLNESQKESTIISILDLLQKSIDILQQNIGKGRSRLNETRDKLLLRLPSEIISQIFIWTVRSFRPFMAPFIPAAAPVFLSHVCRSWRRIALSTPSLWTSYPRGKPFAPEFLRRAGGFPIILRALGRGFSFREINPLLPRCASIEVRDTANALAQLFESHRSSSMDVLEELIIAPIGPFFTLGDLFNGRAPRLHTLKLTRVGIDWTSPLFRSIQTLVLHQIFVAPTQHVTPSAGDFLTVINGSLQLEEIVLSFFTVDPPPWWGTSSPSPTPIILSHLQRFYCWEVPPKQLNFIMDQVHAPNLSKFTLANHIRAADLDFSAFQQLALKSSTRVFQLAGDSLSLEAQGNEETYFVEYGSQQRRFRIQMPLGTEWLVEEKLASVPQLLETVTSLELRTMSYPWDTVRALRLLQNLRLIECVGANHLVRHLVDMPECPLLSTLYVYTKPGADVDGDVDLMDALQSLAEERGTKPRAEANTRSPRRLTTIQLGGSMRIRALVSSLENWVEVKWEGDLV